MNLEATLNPKPIPLRGPGKPFRCGVILLTTLVRTCIKHFLSCFSTSTHLPFSARSQAGHKNIPVLSTFLPPQRLTMTRAFQQDWGTQKLISACDPSLAFNMIMFSKSILFSAFLKNIKGLSHRMKLQDTYRDVNILLHLLKVTLRKKKKSKQRYNHYSQYSILQNFTLYIIP